MANTPTPTNLPQPLSYQQILSNELSEYASKMGLNDIQVASVMSSFFEVNAMAVARASGDILGILATNNIDRASGQVLKQIAADNNVPLQNASASTGTITVTDTSFTKVSTKIYAGASSPNIGSTQILISSATGFPVSGSVYLGRGTQNIEGPIAYSSITAIGSYFALNLTTATTKYHNVGESVVLSQGGVRTIPVSTACYAPATGANPDISFSTTVAAIILDGETSVSGVPVVCQVTGSIGNVPVGGISQFSSAPFSGASVTNPLPFTNGTDAQTDEQLRVAIKRAKASTGLGTSSIVQGSVIGATSSVEAGTISSSSLINKTGFSVLYIDNGTGYEESSTGVGIESIVDSALGGEQYFELATGGSQTQVAKAFLISSLSSPFDVRGGDTLSVTVGEVTYSHTFQNSDFQSPGGATAYEMCTAINEDTTLGFQATTSGGGAFLVISAIAETNDSLKVEVPITEGRDVATQVGFTSSTIETLRLYKNNIPLSKDGAAALIFSQAQEAWSSSIVDGDTLIIAVDNTAPITFTIHNSDFVATGLYTFVSAQNSLESWVEVFNNKLTGLTASLVGTQIQLESNLGNSNRAAISIDPSSTLVTKGMFTSALGLASQGKTSDFSFFRGTAQFQLNVPLVKGDKLSAGTIQTEATVLSSAISGGGLTLAADGHVWILIDQPGTIVSTGLIPNSAITISKPSTNVIRYTSNISSAFSNVLVGDYVIIWSAELPSTSIFEGRVQAVTNSTLDLLITSTEWAAATTVINAIYQQGFTILRSAYIPQKFKIAAGTYSLQQVATAINNQTDELYASVSLNEYLNLSSITKDTSGSLLIVTADVNGQQLLLAAGANGSSTTSLIANEDSGTQEASFPVFLHSLINSEEVANPIDSYITTFNSAASLSGIDPNYMVRFLKPYGIADDQAQNEYVQMSSISGSAVGIKNESNLRRLRLVDRFFLANPLDFGPQDSITVIADNNPSSESFEIPFYRLATTNTTYANNSSSFNAYDTASGASAQFASYFGAFDFSNFKALMQAKKVLKALSTTQTGILYRSAQWGRSGEKIQIGYNYPSQPNQGISNVVTVDSNVNIGIVLQSGNAIASSIDATTEWNVTITPNTPVAGTDQVTYTYAGTGTAPNLTLSGGEYVNIGSQTELNAANTGVFRVSTQSGFTPSSTAFSVQMPHGKAVAQTNAATLVNGQIQFYASSATTAAQIVTYVNANLSQYISATLVNDGGMTGSGVLTYSTYEDTGFAYSYISLKDGVNWISSSNLASVPQFTFKNTLALPSDVGYTFNNGEQVVLTPTTMDQVNRFLNILAVTGFTTVGTVDIVDRGTRIELASNTLGSNGAIQVVGGNANGYSIPVLNTATRLDNTYSQVVVNSSAASGIVSDQWVKLQAANKQNKLLLLSSNSGISVTSNSPVLNESTVNLTGRSMTQRYFGKPRHHIRTQGITFKVEKQGALTCMSWNGVGASPYFQKSALNFNDSAGGTFNAQPVPGSSDTLFQILTGVANFSELSIGDLITISGLASANNGTFLVTGVSDDGTQMRCNNANGVAEYSSGTFTFTGNSTAGDTFVINGVSLVAGTNFPIGGTQAVTVANFAAVAGTVSGVTASYVGSVVTITANSIAANIPISYSGFAVVNVSGAYLSGQPFVAGNFSASSQVSEGDNLVVSGAFSSLNQGTFRVIRQNNNSVWFENDNSVEEEITIPANLINLNVDATTSLKVNASNHNIYLNWNGIGTEPQLGLAQMGDILTLGVDFASQNQGSFMVLSSGAKLQQITSFVMPAGSQFPVTGVSKYFLVNSAANVNQYYVWFNVNGATTDPAPVGYTGVQVNILNGDNDVTVAAKAATVLNSQTGLTASSLGNVLTVTTTGYVETTAASNVNMPSPFSVNLVQAGRRTFLTAVNASAVNQSTVLPATGVFQLNRPYMQFSEYDATIANDSFVVSGNILGSTSNGSFSIVRVIDRDNAIVTGTIPSVTNVSLNGNLTSISVLENVAYVGYKKVFLIAAQPGSTTQSLITFDTNNQYEKIDQSADVQINSLNKMNWPTTLMVGLDSYRYDIGLMATANKILYGDATDPVTYSGVAADGAQIVLAGPLVKRITLALTIRTLTGVPFTQTAQQVQNVVAALINGNPIGQSIPISAIISAAQTVRGVLAVSISSPAYSVSNDLIPLAAAEKAYIVDSTSISVSQEG